MLFYFTALTCILTDLLTNLLYLLTYSLTGQLEAEGHSIAQHGELRWPQLNTAQRLRPYVHRCPACHSTLPLLFSGAPGVIEAAGGIGGRWQVVGGIAALYTLRASLLYLSIGLPPPPRERAGHPAPVGSHVQVQRRGLVPNDEPRAS